MAPEPKPRKGSGRRAVQRGFRAGCTTGTTSAGWFLFESSRRPDRSRAQRGV